MDRQNNYKKWCRDNGYPGEGINEWTLGQMRHLLYTTELMSPIYDTNTYDPLGIVCINGIFHFNKDLTLKQSIYKDICIRPGGNGFRPIFIERNDLSGINGCKVCANKNAAAVEVDNKNAAAIESELCSICYDQEPRHVIITKCNHVFHRACLRLWGRPSCPMCRRNL